MNRPAAGDDGRVTEYWDWISVALFLLVAVDLLTTLAAAGVVGPAAEGNPLMRWLIGQSLGTLVAVHLAVVVLVVVCFRLLLDRLERTPEPQYQYFALAVELWLGLLVSAGLAVFANNLSVIVFGRSLL
jgi:hypothetical protein